MDANRSPDLSVINSIPEKTVYIVSAEIVAFPESQMAKENAGIGGFLYALTVAHDAMQAGQKVSQALAEDNYGIRKIEEIFFFENMDWSTSDDVDVDWYRERVQEAIESGDVEYGIIYSYENEDDE